MISSFEDLFVEKLKRINSVVYILLDTMNNCLQITITYIPEPRLDPSF